MPLLSSYYEQEEPLPGPATAPAAPPVNPSGGSIGPAGPVATPPAVPPPPEAGPSGGGGGGGGAAPAQLPNLPNFAIPGAPTFNYAPFRAPTAESLVNTPGYRSRINAATDALERSAAAQGRLRTGGTLSDLTELSQNFASQEYDKAYNQALSAYDRDYRGKFDAFAPLLERWRLGAQGTRDATLSRYQTELGKFMRDTGGGGGGGGSYFDPAPYLADLMPSGPSGPVAPPPIPAGGGPSPYEQMPAAAMRTGDPWTDPDTLNYF